MPPPCLFEFEKLGSGTYGQIWKAKLFQTGEPRVLKVFNDSRSESKLDMIREAQILNEVQGSHHVVKYFMAYDGTHSDLPIYEKLQSNLFLLLEYVDGSNMWDLPIQGRVENMDWICKQCFDGLDFIHSRGVVHRDLKGGNIMIEKNEHGWRVVIVDFGLSCVDPELGSAIKPCETDHAGTYNYVSPEMASYLILQESPPFEKEYANDVWGIGITLLEFFEFLKPGDGIKMLFPGFVWGIDPQDIYTNLQIIDSQVDPGILEQGKLIAQNSLFFQIENILSNDFQVQPVGYINLLVECFSPFQSRPKASVLNTEMARLANFNGESSFSVN